MSRPDVRGAWVAGFLAVTAAAVGMELFAALWSGPQIAPWTELLAGFVPSPLTMSATAVLVAWLPIHFVNAYRRAREVGDDAID